jgi:DNA-directed RNA polymerase subunit F
MEVLAEEEISAPDAKAILEEREKSGKLVYEQKICLEFLQKAYKLTKKQLEDLKAELSKIAILKPRYIALIINNMPTTEEEVDAIFSKERTSLKREEVKRIVEIVQQFTRRA